MKTKFQLGDTVSSHETYEVTSQCYVCGKELKETNVEVRIALTDNQTLVSVEELNNLSYGSDWSPLIGKSCLKRFPKESIIEEILV